MHENLRPPPQRRWFQFSLRSLFVVVTLLAMGCGYVTWRAKQTIADRRAMLMQIRELGGIVYMRAPDGPQGVPWIRQWLGDQAVNMMTVPSSIGREAHAAFPECAVYEEIRPLWKNYRDRAIR